MDCLNSPSFVLTEEQYIALRKQQRARQIKKILSKPGWMGSDMNLLYERRSQMEIKLEFKTPFVVVGGWAVNEYGPARLTDDLDILVKFSHLDFIKQELLELDATPNLSLEDVSGIKNICHSWILPNKQILDVLTWDEPWIKYAVEKPGTYDKLGNPVCALPYLVIMKSDAGRLQDMADLERLLGFPRNNHLLEAVRKTIAKYRPNYIDDLENDILISQHLYSRTK